MLFCLAKRTRLWIVKILTLYLNSLDQIGFKAPFDIDNDALESTMWFEEELMGNNMADFFHTRPTEYSKKNQSFDEDDLF